MKRIFVILFLVFLSLSNCMAQSSYVIDAGQTITINQYNPNLKNKTLVMSGGTLLLEGPSYQEFRKITLTQNSIIDFAAISSFELYFGNSSLNSWNGVLTIMGWNGDLNGGISNKIIFNKKSNLTPTQLSQINFSGFGNGAILLTSGELVPSAIPEIRVVVSALLIFSLVLWGEIKNWKSS